jgi:hypothetical protein
MSKKCGSRNTRNYGFGRKLDYAITNGLRTHYGDGHFATVQAHSERCSLFCDWLDSEHKILDARHITIEIFHGYASYVRNLVENGEIAIATATNRISSVNVALKILRGDTHIHIDRIGKVLGTQRSHIRTAAPEGMSFEQLNPLIDELIQMGLHRVAAIIMLTRSSGMRLREAILADLSRLKREALKQGEINIQDGSKGGRSGAFSPRWVPATARVLSALEFARNVSPPGSRNMLSPSERYVDFLRSNINAARQTLKAHGISGFHELRASYACNRHADLVGVPAPVCLTEKRTFEHLTSSIRDARQIISRELGHERLEVTNAYLGKKV